MTMDGDEIEPTIASVLADMNGEQYAAINICCVHCALGMGLAIRRHLKYANLYVGEPSEQAMEQLNSGAAIVVDRYSKEADA